MLNRIYNYLFTLICFFLLGVVSIKLEAKEKTIYHSEWIDFNKNGKKDVYEDINAPINKRVENLLQQMSMDEKTAQMATLYGYGRVAKNELPVEQWKHEVWQEGLGNIDEASNGVSSKAKYDYPYDKHVWALNQIQKFFIEQTRLGIPVEFTDEGIRGLNHTKSTCFPAQIGIGCTWDRALALEIGNCIGKEGYALGYNNIYSPVLDITRDQRWGRTVESFGEDPYLVSQYGLNIVKGIQSQGVVSSLKHFAIYSAPKGGRDGNVRCDPHITFREMHNLYLYPFKKVIQQASPLGIMSSYNDYDGVPVSGSDYFLIQLLRVQYGFKGYVVSDSDAVAWIHSKYHVAGSYKDAVKQTVNAGLNVRTTFNPPQNFINPLRELVKEGEVSEDTINSRVADILYVKFKEGLFDSPYKDESKVNDVVRSDKHIELSKRASRESIVLLKNKNQILPLDKSKIKKVLIVGPTAKQEKCNVSRYGSLKIDVVSPYEGIIKKLESSGIDVVYEEGCSLKDKNWPDSEIEYFPLENEEKQKIDDAVSKAKDCDIVFAFMGEDETMVGENLSRTSLDLTGRQNNLLRALKESNTPVVLTLINGRPLSINYAQREVDAILTAWFPGEFGGDAIADILFGDYNPSGRLSTTWPATVGQIPINFPHKAWSQAGQAAWGPNGTGYSRIVKPLYDFGYGLSYSSFEYSDIKINNNLTTKTGELVVSCKITNTSDIDGVEVPQLYVQDEESSVTTYEWQLRGFDKVTIPAHQSKIVEFKLIPDDIALINRDMERVVEPGKFKIKIAKSSVDSQLEKEFEVK